MEFPCAVRKQIRQRDFFVAGLFAAASRPAVSVLSVDRSALGEKPEMRAWFCRANPRPFWNRLAAADRHADFAFRPPKGSCGCRARLPDRETLYGLPACAGGGGGLRRVGTRTGGGRR